MNKKIKKVGALLLIGGTLVTSVPATFANENILSSGSESFVAGAPTTKGVTGSSVAGGWWRRGMNGPQIVSEYTHYSSEGHATTVDGKGNKKEGGWKQANITSNANQLGTSSGTNKAYYKTR